MMQRIRHRRRKGWAGGRAVADASEGGTSITRDLLGVYRLKEISGGND